MTKKIYVIAPFFVLVFIACLIQSQIYIIGDVGYLLHVTDQLLAGEKYGATIFETNPPMIGYLYMPIAILAKIGSLNIALLVIGYVFILIFISLYLCLLLMKKIVHKEDNIFLYCLFYALSIILIFLPANNFGQKEHLYLILIFPYLFSVVLTRKGIAINGFLAFMLGIMAALGMGMKPFFLAPFIILEMYLILTTKRLWMWVRIETMACVGFLILYLISVWLYQPDYFNIILPLVSHYYFIGMEQQWSTIFSEYIVIYCIISLFSFILIYRVDRYKVLTTVMILSLVGMSLAFLMTKTGWFYHVLPALGLACFLDVICLAQYFTLFIRKNNWMLEDILFIFLVSGILFYPPIYNTYLWLNIQKNSDSSRANLIAYVQAYPKKTSVFCFSLNTTEDCFPLVNLTHSIYGGTPSFFWWLPGMFRLEKNLNIPSIELAQDKSHLIDKLSRDLNYYQTRLVIINLNDLRLRAGPYFSFIRYFSQNKKFNEEWKHYQYKVSLGDYAIYERD